VRTQGLFSALAPFGPIDPRDWPTRKDSLLAPPFPDIAIAAGRKTAPYLRHLRKASKGRTFTVFLQNPGTGSGIADMVWVPAHDKLRGPNVVVTPTSPHPLRPALLDAARQDVDPRIASLPIPRAAMILGGPSAHHAFEAKDDMALADAARALLAQGFSVMVTPSRRTAPETLAAIRASLASAPGKSFVWDGAGENPYPAMIANADAILVTGDSVNMVGEALATRAPVHVYEPSGGHRKIRGYLEGLMASGVIRPWRGAIEDWTHEPVDATGLIAAEIVRRYGAFRTKRAEIRSSS